jgi:hypothetical protein
MTPLTLRRAGLLAASTLAAGLLAAPAQAADKVDLTGGGTTLRLAPATARALDGLGVSVAPTGRAAAGARGVTFPITGGSLDPQTARGVIRHTGGLRLRAGHVRVTLSDFNVVVGRRSTMSARVDGGGRLGALRPVVDRARIARDGLTTTVSNVQIRLSARGATALNRAFGVRAFTSRLVLGTATIRARSQQVAFAGGRTDLALDPAAGAALTSLGVAPGLVGDARANADGSFAFPITGGKVNARTLAGDVRHSGGISLTKGATRVELTNFDIDTAERTLSANVTGVSGKVAILSLDLSAIERTDADGTVTVANVPARLTKPAADALNAAFGVTAFAEGLQLGVATIRGELA